MARREIRQEVFAFTADPIPHCGSLDRPSGRNRLVHTGSAAGRLVRFVGREVGRGVEDRASFRRFCGFAAHEPTPGHTAFVRFRRELTERALDKALFDEVTRQLKAEAIAIKTGTLVDATAIASATYQD